MNVQWNKNRVQKNDSKYNNNKIQRLEMEKIELFEENNQNAKSQQRKPQPKKRQLIRKDTRRKDRRQRVQTLKPSVQQQQQSVSQQAAKQFNSTNNLSSLQSEKSKFQRLDEFWKVDIENLYRKEFTQEDRGMIASVLGEKRPTVVEVFRNEELALWREKISLEQLWKYISLVQQLGSDSRLQFMALVNQGRKEHYVLVLNQHKQIQKLIQVTQQQLQLLTYRQQCLSLIKQKTQTYNSSLNRHQTLNQLSQQLIFLTNYMSKTKQQLDTKLREIQTMAQQIQKPQPPPQVQQNYVMFLIKKNLRKALEDQEIDYYNHFKRLDVGEHVAGLIDSKPITDKREFQEYIRKKKLKKTGKKARWVLKTACAGCLSYHYELYNPFSFCTQCHCRFHKYCYVPKNQGICQSCFLSKSNQTKRSRINQCQLCGTRGFLYLPMDQSSNAHVFCMLINGLWSFQNSQITFKRRHVQNAVQNAQCVICKQANSCIYKCEQCNSHAHPLCAYISGWGVGLEQSKKGNEVVKLQCCGVQREKNQKRRRFVLNYKRCVYSQCQ